LRDRRGAVAVAVAVLLPVLIGFAGIGIEVGLWFAVQRQNQSAADAAAISAALEYAAQIQRGVAPHPAAATAAATTAANCNLFSTSSSSSNAVCSLPSSASNTITLYSTGTPNAVQVVLTQPLNTTFANLVTAIWGPNVNTVNVTTSAIAAFTAGTACFLALDASAANAFLVDNGGTLPNSKCWAASNSSSGSALNCNGCTIAGPTNVVGGDAVSNGGQLNGSPNRTYAGAIADPYASVSVAGVPAPGTLCTFTPTTPVTSGSNGPIRPGHYCGGIQIADGSTLTMLPGVYSIDKVFNISNHSTLNANGVTIIINDTYCIGDGTCQTGHGIGNNSTLNITAPSTGPFPGIAIFGPRDSSPAKVQEFVAGSQINIQGAIYFPSQTILFDPSSQLKPSLCTQIIGDMIHIQTNASISNSCGGAAVGSISILQVYLSS
jgi:Flp pilus assembly protein TadG